MAQNEGQTGPSGSKDKMRSSKSRSRSKQNRPRTLGNIVNRVFDSSGPEGKVRGTPQQIIEKYLVLARDAQLSNDRVAAENFLQHAEHYTRMLAEAQREMAAEQEARQQQYQQNGNGNRDRDYRDNRENRWRDDRNQDPGAGEQPDVPAVTSVEDDADSNLVETPEARGPEKASEGGHRDQRPRRDDRNNRGRDRRERGPRNDNRSEGEAPAAAPVDEAPAPAAVEAPVAAPAPSEAAPAPAKPAAPKAEGEAAPVAEEKPRRPRAPRKPKAEAKPSDDGNGADPKPEAAE